MIDVAQRLAVAFANLVGVMLVPVGAWIAADSADVERWVGGGIIVTAGVLLVRWALRTSERVEATYVQALESANERAKDCDRRCAEIQAKYEQERDLRMQLEQRGMTDRRHNLREEA